MTTSRRRALDIADQLLFEAATSQLLLAQASFRHSSSVIATALPFTRLTIIFLRCKHVDENRIVVDCASAAHGRFGRDQHQQHGNEQPINILLFLFARGLMREATGCRLLLTVSAS
ncbi:hypothetical protein MPSEU_000577600 [Mayamaea pseudoterrestris]|nr:hypothetical protein MPSEU_000577600 [Mayamaea pseudoterrestris]